MAIRVQWVEQTPLWRVRFFGSGMNAEKDRGGGNWRYNFAAGKAKWKFQLRGVVRETKYLFIDRRCRNGCGSDSGSGIDKAERSRSSRRGRRSDGAQV
jgi:hypothetical protein